MPLSVTRAVKESGFKHLPDPTLRAGLNERQERVRAGRRRHVDPVGRLKEGQEHENREKTTVKVCGLIEACEPPIVRVLARKTDGEVVEVFAAGELELAPQNLVQGRVAAEELEDSDSLDERKIGRASCRERVS